MPISVSQLFNILHIENKGSEKWGTPIDNYCAGIYIISTAPDPQVIDNVSAVPKFDNNKINEWIERVGKMTIDGEKATLDSIKARLSQFWLPDENILYIGQANDQTLKKRTRQFYNQKIGKKGSHAGGFWLLTLSNLTDLYVHFGDCMEPKKIETIMQEHFIKQVSKESLALLKDVTLPLPFANVRFKGKDKNHGFNYHKI